MVFEIGDKTFMQYDVLLLCLLSSNSVQLIEISNDSRLYWFNPNLFNSFKHVPICAKIIAQSHFAANGDQAVVLYNAGLEQHDITVPFWVMGWPNQQLSFRDLWLHEDLGKLLLRMALNRPDVLAISYFIFATLMKQNELYSIHFKVILVIGEQSGDDDSFAHAQAPFPTTSRPVLPATVCRRSVSLVSINDQ